ncbi:MAG: helix-turn-helix domain-containing protein [Candidatus Desulfofervidaceae bacterium]|nr:helix-turn-helix domain-containing protein [Candidatus Desulfofervidaceae bacterium]MDL1970533.1 helix-turn-helix domain-containing protein [Candidatus Desulfofervidaceae bacterium]
MKSLAKRDITFGTEVNLKQLQYFKDYPVECLVLNEREAKLCAVLDIKTLGKLAATPVKRALEIRNLWHRSVQSLMAKLAQFVTNWSEVETDFLQTPFTEILQKMARFVPSKERVFFIRRYFYGETLSEIGKDYGLTREAVRQKLLKAKKSLQTPNWEKVVNLYLEKHIVPLFKKNQREMLPKEKVAQRLQGEFKNALPVACATFILLEQLYFEDKNTECAKVVRIARRLLERIVKRTFDSHYRRVCRQGEIGKKIRMLRRLQGWTQAELAKRLGCARITVNMWEQGKSIPKGKNIEKIARVFGLPKEALVMG